MTDHSDHYVQWCSWEGMSYRLYCLACERWTQYETRTPNSLQRQVFTKAFDKPKEKYEQKPTR